MSTTTIRIPDDLKRRIAEAAERTGKTTHSLILEAIAEKADAEDRRRDFDEEAEKRFAEIVASGRTIPWGEMRSCLEDRARGNVARHPVPRKRR
jgi:predicted transcriptional regulator